MGSSTVPFTDTKRARSQPEPPELEATAVIFHEAAATVQDDAQSYPTITAVDHDLLATPIFDGLAKPNATDDEHEGVPIVDAAPVSMSSDHDFGFPDDIVKDNFQELEDEDPLSASMQSLVEGLMNWGGQYSAEDDFTLPAGMAASIVMEESNAFGTQI